MKKLAIIDLNFSWPPDGGAPVDLYQIASRLLKDFEVRLFLPKLSGSLPLLNRTKFYRRGKLNNKLPFAVEHIPLRPSSLNKIGINSFLKAVKKFQPDHLFIADAWYLKPDLIEAFADYQPWCRIYANEMLCLKGNGFFFRRGKICQINYLNGRHRDWLKCFFCSSSFYLTYPSPTWIHEAFKAKAFCPSYRKKVTNAMARAKGFIVYNERQRQLLLPFNNNVKIIPSGVETDLFIPQKKEIEPTVKKIIFIGRAEEPRKGLTVLINALRRIWLKRKDFILQVTCKKLPYKDPFIEYGGWLEPKELAKKIAAADLAVIPSLWPEPHGIASLEAQSCGLATIVSDVGGLSLTVKNDKSGYLVQANNSVQLAEKIEFLLSNRAKCLEMGRTARDFIVSNYSWDNIYQNFYKNLFSE